MDKKNQIKIQKLCDKGDLSGAYDKCMSYIKRHKTDDNAWSVAGQLAAQMGDLKAAANCFQTRATLTPKDVDAQINLGQIYGLQHQFVEAARCFNQALALAPNNLKAKVFLGNIELEQRHYLQAEASFADALMQDGAYYPAHMGRARLLEAQGKLSMAAALYEDLFKAYPNDMTVCMSLGGVSILLNQLQRAEACFKHVLQKMPDDDDAYNNLGIVYDESGRLAEAAAHYKKAISLNPNKPMVFSNYLFLSSYHVMLPLAELMAAHQFWDRRFGGKARAQYFDNARSVRGERTHKRLRIGYISGDFRRHVVSRFFEPVLKYHDHSAFEIYCYSEVASPDEVTKRLKTEPDHWCDVVAMSDEALAAQVFEDEIDILIDLSGHTRGNRLTALTLKPAPVQALYMGYCTTTGLTAMDYWITDEWLHPSDTQEQSSETIIRLPRCWLCYEPDPDSPAVLECDPQRPVTFASFNNLNKLTDEVVAVWSQILQRVPGSSLYLKAKQLSEQALCGQVRARFAAQGISAEQLRLEGNTAQYLDCYNVVDIALDPFPRTGGGTTADALWMGVPLISLAGDRFIARQGVSMLASIGHPEWVADTVDDYINKAVALAQDTKLRQQLRSHLRSEVESSPLLDGQGLSQAMEAVYHDLWQRHIKNIKALPGQD